MSRSTRSVLMTGAAVVTAVAVAAAEVVVMVIVVVSRSGSSRSNVSIVLFRGASGLLHGVGEPLRLPAATPSAASDELEDEPASNSVYSCKEKCKRNLNETRTPNNVKAKLDKYPEKFECSCIIGSVINEKRKRERKCARANHAVKRKTC